MHFYLLQAATTSTNSAYWYLPIGLQFLFAIGFVVVMMGVTHLLGPSRRTSDKLANFESGIESVWIADFQTRFKTEKYDIVILCYPKVADLIYPKINLLL